MKELSAECIKTGVDSTYKRRLPERAGSVYEHFSNIAAIGYNANQGSLVGQTSQYLSYAADNEFLNIRAVRSILDLDKPEEQEARHLGGLWGINMRVVDDVLDGHYCESLEDREDREEFLGDYLSVLEGEQTSQGHSRTPIEALAMKPAEQLLRELSGSDVQNIVPEIRKMTEALLEEDKGSRDGYASYVEAAGGRAGRIAVKLAGSATQEDIAPEIEKLGYELGFLGQIQDDIRDADTGLTENEIMEIMQDRHFETNTGKIHEKIIRSHNSGII